MAVPTHGHTLDAKCSTVDGAHCAAACNQAFPKNNKPQMCQKIYARTRWPGSCFCGSATPKLNLKTREASFCVSSDTISMPNCCIPGAISGRISATSDTIPWPRGSFTKSSTISCSFKLPSVKLTSSSKFSIACLSLSLSSGAAAWTKGGSCVLLMPIRRTSSYRASRFNASTDLATSSRSSFRMNSPSDEKINIRASRMPFPSWLS
mmetsp:Transcript_17760/g.30819  ORF Transcript_17760/g.30819 Transcript_17760/m.30819 type:complete len:207 (+) Transcript_17760:872-1492(+)